VIGLKLAAIAAAVGAAASLGAYLVGHHNGVEDERQRIAAERYESVRAIVADNLRTRQKLDAVNTGNQELATALAAKELEVARLSRVRDQLWNRRADEDVACAAWFDQPVACRLRDDPAIGGEP
jgi:predicted aminopeptidase